MVAGDENMVFKNALNCKEGAISQITSGLDDNVSGVCGNNTYPSSIAVDETMAIRIPIFIKKLGNRYPKEEGEPSNDKVSHGVHVCELKK